MPYIESFNIEGLAGRSDAVVRKLNKDVNVFFGANGCGKTSLLRIFHSALMQQAELVREVSFKSAQINICSWAAGEFEYNLDKSAFETAEGMASGMLLRKIRNGPEWRITPPDDAPWYDTYLPIARLYEGNTQTELSLYGSRDDSERGLEARFASNLLSTWKDYQRRLSQELNRIQEEGLARILERVLSRNEAPSNSQSTDSRTAYEAVSTFLARRGVEGSTPSPADFEKRFSRERQFRGLVQEIEEIERKIVAANAPVKALELLVGEMFVGGKNLVLKDDSIEVAVAGKGISLSSLSSGEKQLLKILVATVNAGISVMLVDEPELSMHVDWQRRLIPVMRTLNPGAQLIIATHSPEIMADIPDNQVFHI